MSDVMDEEFRLNTRNRMQLLMEMMSFFAAQGCRISFEGHLSRSDLLQIDGVQIKKIYS